MQEGVQGLYENTVPFYVRDLSIDGDPGTDSQWTRDSCTADYGCVIQDTECDQPSGRGPEGEVWGLLDAEPLSPLRVEPGPFTLLVYQRVRQPRSPQGFLFSKTGVP